MNYWEEVVPKPRVFKWNLMRQSMLKNSCIDIDGVLCSDPTREENDDGENYRGFLTGIESHIVPSKKIGWLVTCRLEKYQNLTEAWLDKHRTEYDNLVMMDLPSKEVRQSLGNHVQYKAKVYKLTDADLFIESSPGQAAEISECTRKPVYCYESNQMIQPGALDRMYNKGTSAYPVSLKDPSRFR